MPSRPRRIRVVLALAAFVAALAAWQGAAMGALTATNASLNVSSNGDTDPATSVSSPPGGVFRAFVVANVTSPGTWNATRYELKSDPPGTATSTCVDHDPPRQEGIRQVHFNVTAPGTAGAYDAGFLPNGAQGCIGTEGTQAPPNLPLDKAVNVTQPAPNPGLAPRCGIDVQLILDESGSIGTSGATGAVKDAAKAFVNALDGTGSSLAIIDFSTTAQRQIDYTEVTPTSITNTFFPYINNQYIPNGWTNWEDAFREAKETNKIRRAPLVVFVTDGDPTARNTSSGTVTGLVEGEALALTKAAHEADDVKDPPQGVGSHVFVVGVGAAVTDDVSARRLTAVSGPDEYVDLSDNLRTADFTRVKNFADLEQALQDIANELCQSSVTITKLVDEGDGNGYQPDPGWQFTAAVETDPEGFAWLAPKPGRAPPNERAATTGPSGVAKFQWRPDDRQATSRVSITEAVQPNYEFVDAVCEKNLVGRTRLRTFRSTQPTTIHTGVLGPQEWATCTVRNRRVAGPPEPPDPLTPPAPPPPPPTTQLEVEKTAPATARVGQRIPFSLTVTNVGPIPAENVQLRDIPPGAIGLNDLRSTSKASLAGRSATWSIGTLAPGESRTVRGTVRIVSGTPGKKHNTVLASADNADTVNAYADTRLRVLAQRRVIPPVTG